MRVLSETSSIPQGGPPIANASGPAPRRWRLAWLCNLVAPGTGLILAGRLRRGASLALVFTLSGVTACWGWWIVPLSIPPWLRWICAACALAAWIGAQTALRRLQRAASCPPPDPADADPAVPDRHRS